MNESNLGSLNKWVAELKANVCNIPGTRNLYTNIYEAEVNIVSNPNKLKDGGYNINSGNNLTNIIKQNIGGKWAEFGLYYCLNNMKALDIN